MQLRPPRAHLASLLVVVFAGALRLRGLGTDSLRTDELVIISRAGGSLEQLLGRIGQTVMGAPMEFLLRHAVLNVTHDDYFLRLPDALMGTLSVYLLYRLASRLFDSKTGLAASVLLAVSGLHLFHSTDARYYSLYCLLTLVSTLFLLRARDGGRPGEWTAYSLSMIVGFYTCYFMAFVAFVHALFILGPLCLSGKWRESAPGRGGFLLSGVAIALAVAPWLLFYRPDPNIPYGPTELTYALQVLSSGFSGGRGWIEVVYVGLFVAGLVLAQEQDLSPVVLCLLFVVVPFPIIVWLDNRFLYFFAPRQMIFALPFFLTLVSYGMVRASVGLASIVGRPNWLQQTALVALVTLCVSLSAREQRAEQPQWGKEDWRGAAQYLLDRMRPGDVVAMSYPPAGPPDGDNVSYYLRTLGPEAFPYRIVNTALTKPGELEEIAQRGRVWVVIASRRFFEARPDFFAEMERNFAKEAAFPGGLLYQEIQIYRSRR